MSAVAAYAGSTKEDQFTLKSDDPSTGTNINYVRARSSDLPVNKRYEELTDAQKKIVRDSYDNLPDSDEPPFPLYGLKPIYAQLADIQERLRTSGKISADVMIDSKGEADSISVYESPDPAVTQIIGFILMKAKYKPAKCNGVPCKMAYRFDINFTMDM